MTDTSKNLSQILRDKMRADNKRFWAGDNISEYVDDNVKPELINEATLAFESVLDAAVKKNTLLRLQESK
jgi:hypothetical protein